MSARRPALLAVLTLLMVLAGLGTLTGPATAAAGRVSASDHPHGPALLPRADTRLVDRPLRGAAAVRALGDRLHDAAARSGMSATRLRTLLETDHTAWVDRTGRLYFKEAPVPASVIASAPSSPQTAAATVPDVFALHSRPASTHTIYLNFVGMYVSNTAWNSTTVPAGNYSGFSLDSDYAAFSSTERADIQEIWERVAAAYAPFDVDVTTAPQPLSAFTRSSSSDNTYGTQVLIDSSSTDPAAVCGGECAGIAYVGTFAQDSSGAYSPAWVFPYGAGGSVTYIAQSAEHEAGHTFGLVHDGVINSDGSFDSYYGGHGMWGPIMGGGTPRALYQFNDGDYPGAKIESSTQTYQDDLAVIAQSAPLLADDAGDSTSTAADLGDQTSYSTTGMIGTRADADVFRITRTCTGTLSVSANPTVQNSPLDIGLSVLDSTGRSVATAAPASSAGGTASEPLAMNMGASVSPSAGPGTYYVRVEGVGNGDTTTGYSDYGSVGAYQLTASGCPPSITTTTTPTTAPTPTTTGTTSPTATTSASTGASTGGSGGSTVGSGGTSPTGSTGGPGITTSSRTFSPVPALLRLSVDRLHRRLSVAWSDLDVPPAGTSLLDWQVQLVDEATGTEVRRTVTAGTLQETFSSLRADRYAVQLRSSYSDGTGATSAASTTMPAPVRATSPRSVHGHPGARGGAVTAGATWGAPASPGSYPVTGYQVQVLHLDGTRVLSRRVLATRFGATTRAATVAAGRTGNWSFRVRALTAAGSSAWSAPSSAVRAR